MGPGDPVGEAAEAAALAAYAHALELERAAVLHEEVAARLLGVEHRAVGASPPLMLHSSGEPSPTSNTYSAARHTGADERWIIRDAPVAWRGASAAGENEKADASASSTVDAEGSREAASMMISWQ